MALAWKIKLRRYTFLFMIIWLTSFGCSLNTAAQQTKTAKQSQPKCEKITIPLCTGIGYNYTQYPNFLGQDNQKEAESKIHEFKPLIAVNCAPQLRFFLCSVFAPMCTKEVKAPIYACRSMCEAARSGCTPMMRRFGFDWPDTLDCSRLSQKNDPRAKSEPERLCMAAPNMKHTPVNDSTILNAIDNLGPEFKEIFKNLAGKIPTEPKDDKDKVNPTDSLDGGYYSRPNATLAYTYASLACTNNTGPLKTKYTHVSKYDQCIPKCPGELLFSKENKRFANIWISVWAVLCFISTAITVLTFAIDTTRFKYPERPIIFLSVCYNLYSLGYIVRMAAGREAVICDSTKTYLIRSGMNVADHACCSVVFLLLYYFGMASALWWVVLTLAWFLAAGRKWGQEAIERKATYFHVIAWTIPAIQTILALIMRKVDSDELTGLCYVGNTDPKNLAHYVIVPLVLYLVAGTIFLFAGFFSLFRIRTVLKNKETNTDKLEKLIVRIGVFSVLYIIPVTCVVVCYFYEHNNMKTWEIMAPLYVLMCRDDSACLESYGPNTEVFVVKYFMLLIIGITSNMWIWSTKTFKSWRMFYIKKTGKKHKKKKMDFAAASEIRKPPPVIQPQPQTINNQYSTLIPPTPLSISSSAANNPSFQQSKASGLSPMATV
ncbi:frizzled-9-like [Actinia tenebrosa]|uniref:Frizzled-9-like n=1 Tax=Actinia tenebrosa TaxID=6105 RepID=A0A6P8IVM9_ACTTE|nr:frizzled-9-like [Actinia tenebrosa]